MICCFNAEFFQHMSQRDIDEHIEFFYLLRDSYEDFGPTVAREVTDTSSAHENAEHYRFIKRHILNQNRRADTGDINLLYQFCRQAIQHFDAATAVRSSRRRCEVCPRARFARAHGRRLW